MSAHPIKIGIVTIGQMTTGQMVKKRHTVGLKTQKWYLNECCAMGMWPSNPKRSYIIKMSVT